MQPHDGIIIRHWFSFSGSIALRINAVLVIRYGGGPNADKLTPEPESRQLSRVYEVIDKGITALPMPRKLSYAEWLHGNSPKWRGCPPRRYTGRE
jgi:hypothetical protein